MVVTRGDDVIELPRPEVGGALADGGVGCCYVLHAVFGSPADRRAGFVWCLTLGIAEVFELPLTEVFSDRPFPTLRDVLTQGATATGRDDQESLT